MYLAPRRWEKPPQYPRGTQNANESQQQESSSLFSAPSPCCPHEKMRVRELCYGIALSFLLLRKRSPRYADSKTAGEEKKKEDEGEEEKQGGRGRALGTLREGVVYTRGE